MTDLFVSIPSVRGVHPLTMWNVFDWRTALEKAGHRLHGSSVYRMPLDLARNELATAYLSTPCEMNLLLDDDVQVAAECIVPMMQAIEAGAHIVSAPCKLRDHSHGGAIGSGMYNVIPKSDVLVDKGGLRLLECSQTGLGAVLVSRHVMESLQASVACPPYASRLMSGKTSAAIFRSEVRQASDLQQGAPEDLNVYILDDMVFSMKARALGFTIYAAIDVPTVHDGMAGNFGVEVDRIRTDQELAERSAPSRLVGADGKPVKR